MNHIIKQINYWWHYWHFRFLVWKLNRAMNNFSCTIGSTLVPALEDANIAFSALGKAFQQSAEKGITWKQN